MKAIKRTVAALLATLMLATSTSFTLAAENYTAEEAEVVAKVNAAGIMTGNENGEFMPSKSLTRAEAAAIIVRMKGISESAVKTAAGTTLFNDVAASHWASGYVNQASNLGIVKGVSAKEFAPDREVTIAEFTTMAVRALGAGTLVDSEGTWPTNYVNFANEEGILDDVNAIYTATASRLQAATIVANTLEAVMWEKSQVKTNGEITWAKSSNEDTILDDILKLKEVKFTLDAISTKDQEIDIKSGSLTPATVITTLVGVDVADRFDLTSVKVGLTYNAYYDTKEKEITGMWIDEEESKTFTAITKYETVSTGKDKITLTVDGKEKEYTVKSNSSTHATEAVLHINERTADEWAAMVTTVETKDKDIKDIATATVYFEDGDVASIYMTTYEAYGVVDEVTSKKVKFLGSSDVKVAGTPYSRTVSSLDYTDEDIEFFLTKDGKGISYGDLKAGDAVRYYTVGSTDKYVGEVISSDKIVEGKVTAVASDDKYVKIDRVKYDSKLAGFRTNDEVRVYLNDANEIVMYEKIEEEASDMAVVKEIRKIDDKYGKDNWEVKLLYTDGSVSDTLTVDLEGTFDEFVENSITLVPGVSALEVVDETPGTGEVLDTDATTNAAVATTTFADGDIAYLYSAKYYTLNQLKDALDALSTGAKEDLIRTYIGAATTGLVDANTVASKWQGFVTGYEVNGDELVLCAVDADEYDTQDSTSIKVNKNTIKVGNYYITKSTKIYNLKEDGQYKVKFETMSYDDLDSKSSGVSAFIIGYDENTKDADVVIFKANTTLNRVSEAKFAFVSEVSDTKYNNKSAKEVDVIYLDGTTATYTYCPSEADNSSITFAQGKVFDLTVSDDMIMDATVPANAKDTLELATATSKTYNGYKYLVDKFDGRVVVANSSSDKKDLLISDEMLVVKSNAAGTKFTVKSIDDIDETDLEDAIPADQDTIEAIWTYTDEDETAAVVIVYKEN